MTTLLSLLLLLLLPASAGAQGLGVSLRPNTLGLVCSAYIPNTAGCTPNRTNATLGAPGTDAQCPGPTVEATGAGPGACQTTDSDLIAFPVNNLTNGVYRVRMTFTLWNSGAFDFVSAAINDGTTTAGQQQGNDLETAYHLSAYFTYTHAGLANKTFTLYTAATTGTAGVLIVATNTRVNFSIEKVKQ